MMKKQKKERDGVISSQMKAWDKLAKSKKAADPTKDPDLLALTVEHTKQWTQMVQKHRVEEWAMLKTHLAAQEETFKKHFEAVQTKQMKEMEAFFARETKDMMATQAKVSVDTAKEVQQDATLKTKADKDRRLREKNQANTKKFMDERKNNMMKQNKRKEKQKKLHDAQLADISQYIQDSIQIYVNDELDMKLADRQEGYA